MPSLKLLVGIFSTTLLLTSCAGTNLSSESAAGRVTMSTYESPIDEKTLFSLREPYVGYATVTRITSEQNEQFMDPVTNTPTMGSLYFRYLDLKFENDNGPLLFRVKIFSDLSPKIDISSLIVGDLVFLMGDGDRRESGFIWFSPRYLASVNKSTQVLYALKENDVTNIPLSLINEKFNLHF